MNERLRRRLELRRSNAAVPHRNRAREAKTNPPVDDDCDGKCARFECVCPTPEDQPDGE